MAGEVSRNCYNNKHAICIADPKCTCICHGERVVNTTIPIHLIVGLSRYKDHHIKPGGFLTAVLENDLTKAILQADEQNSKILSVIVRWCCDELPGASWGSPERVASWIEQTHPNGE